MEANMNAAFSFPISIGIIAFGIWIAAGTIGGSSPLSWALMGLLTVIVGSISLYQAIRENRLESFWFRLKHSLRYADSWRIPVV
jgi:hypothetical protein